MIGRNEAPSTQTNGLIEIAPDTSNELVFADHVPLFCSGCASACLISQ